MRIVLAITLTLVANLSYGQFKTIKTTKGTAPSQSIEIEVPESKKKIVEQRVQGTWQPQTLNYVQSNSTLKVAARDGDMTIFIEGLIPTDHSRGLSLGDQAKNYLVEAKDLMGIAQPTEEWKVVSVNTDELAMHHIKFQQMYNGVPIYGSEVIVHGDAKGMYAVNGRYNTTPTIDNIVPQIAVQVVAQQVRNQLGELVKPTDDKFDLFESIADKSELVLLPYEGEMRLAYHMTAYENVVQRWEYFLDANTGAVLSKHESICRFHNHSVGHKCNHAAAVPPVVSNSQDLNNQTQAINTFQSGSNFFMIDAARTSMFDAAASSMPNEPVGTIWTIDAFDTSPQQSNFNYDHVSSSNINFPGKNIAVSAHVNGGKAFDYFSTVHNRLSINGQGGNIISFVNVADEDGGGMDNAFWNGIAMFYGSGRTGFRELARGLDVAGHEMTHGVIQSTANLEYRGESGALNESFADVFGVMIDRDDWLVGEDVVNSSSFPSGALRSMSDPHNGAAIGDFGNGFQPKKYSERFTGSQDNGGVHINSGIPNHAFFLFANNSAVGKAKAEKVYYRALTTYLTKSSQFVDARVATVRAAMDLYGATEVAALRSAWDAVEVFGENGGNYEEEEETNPGADLIVFTSVDAQGQNDLFIANPDGSLVFNPLTSMNPISPPSVTDDGSEILYVTAEEELGYVFVNWQTNEIVQDIIFNSDGGWRNAVFSKDGLRMAALRQVEEPEIFVFDFVSGTGNFYTLSNPTFSQDGTTTDDVVFADALEFDFTGEYVMYDAFNRIEGIFGSNIEYWDIGFVKVWNNNAQTFALEGDIQKLFNGLPEGVSIGNPTFAKNSPFIIAYDELEDEAFKIKATNLETNQTGTIFSGGDRPGYPSYSVDDNALIFDAANTSGQEVIAGVNLADSKIEPSGQAGVLLSYDVGVRWGVWFGNGDRVISDVLDEQLAGQLKIYPNPTTGIVNLEIGDEIKDGYTVSIVDMMGRVIATTTNQKQIDMSGFAAGQYILSLKSGQNILNSIISKQ